MYDVFSLAPYDWPPVPSMFLAGKKVRFTADGRLVESTPAGERYVFRFDDTTESSYEIPEDDGATLVRRRREQRGPAILEDFGLVAYLAVGGEARAAQFLKSFGLLSCDAGLSVKTSRCAATACMQRVRSLAAGT